ncbi:MAG TPA: sulfatase-like hydrolase/transferase, partial [Bacteroidia bacterium]|nr:sulfatase-like hydrolase/transferase [Bacteroidia bacterium]
TRYSLLTGAYAFRTKGTGIAPPAAPAIIQPGTPTLPAMLKGAGYRTAVVGKWHLGLGGPDGPDWNGEIAPGPLDIGFDHCLLLPTTNDRVPQVYVEDRRVVGLDPADPIQIHPDQPSPDHPTGLTHRDQLRMDWTHGHNNTIHNGIGRIGFYTGGEKARFRDEDLADEWVKRAVAWMGQGGEEPFFLFFASHDPHVPRMPHERFQGTTPHGPRTDSIVQLDWCVGELMAALDRLGIAQETLVVFCSDNGPVMDDGYVDGALEKVGEHRAAGPFKGGKYSVYEGGTRTPFLVRWPGTVAPGVSDEIVSTIDLFASFAKLTGGNPGGAADSENMLGALLGEEGAKGRAELVQQDNGPSNFGFRSGNWKLVRYDSQKARNPVVEAPREIIPVPRFQLFDLASDPGETKDLLEHKPELAVKLKKRLEEIVGR